MEQEFKWDAESTQIPTVLSYLGLSEPNQVLTMSAIYYDTQDRYLSRKKAGLRIRKENSDWVCCLKISEPSENGAFIRQEYEVPACEIQEGLHQLLKHGAPESLCRQLLQADLVPICRTDFTRKAYLYQGQDFTMEIAFDTGFFNQIDSFSEWEAEYKNGQLETFLSFCQQMQTDLELSPQPLSKLARAMAARPLSN